MNNWYKKTCQEISAFTHTLGTAGMLYFIVLLSTIAIVFPIFYLFSALCCRVATGTLKVIRRQRQVGKFL